jgi:hypothetical protein
MIDFKLTDNGDLDMSGTDLLFVTDINQLAQNLKIRLQTFLEEWFLDQTIGLPYFQEIFVKNPNETFITNYIKKVIKETQGVIKILAFSFEYINDEPQKRELKISFVCETIYSINFTFNLAIPIN